MEQAQFWLPEGTILSGRYRLDRMLGSGGYGITYKGWDTRLQRTVAIKEFFPKFWASRFAQRTKEPLCQRGWEDAYRGGISRFLDEARVLAQLSGVSGVVQVNDYFEENNTAYLVMEYLDGKNLKQMVDGFGGRIPPNVLVPAMSSVIAALRQVHAHGLIHRDISPDNIMMLEDGSIRLIDFGNARDTTDDRSMTMAMKEGFAPPEQYKTHGQGTYTDVYSVCATMYYCLSGKLPPKPMDRLTGASFYSLTELGVTMSSQWEQAILDGLELYVAKRIQTMEELWQRLYVPEEPPVPIDSFSRRPDTPPAEPIRETVKLDVTQANHVHSEDALLESLQKIRSIFAQVYRKIKEL